MPSVLEQLELVEPMQEHEIEQQPVFAWLVVERMLRDGWPLTCQIIHTLKRLPDPSPHQTGWLRITHIAALEALDVPVRRLFTLVKIEMEKRGIRHDT